MFNGPLKVLIADDSPVIVQRLREMISELDFVSSVGYAKDGAETLALVEFMNPDVILLDIHMPGVNGLQVLDEVRKQMKEIKVILITNHPDEDLKSQCLQRGADFIIDKSNEFDRIPELLNFRIRRAEAS